MNNKSDQETNIIEEVKDLIAPKNTYAKVKGVWLTFTDGKPKVKLRKYIADKAKLLHKINGFSFVKNRNDLKESYDLEGLDGIHQFLKEEVDLATKKRKREIEKLKAKQTK